MTRLALRPMGPEDWIPVPIAPGKYRNSETLTGFQRRDRQRGNPLHPALGDDRFEMDLAARLRVLEDACPGAIARRYHVAMPFWQGLRLPRPDDYDLVAAPQRLASTSVTVVMLPNHPGVGAGLTFSFDGNHLPTLRERIRATCFEGLVGNLGYFMTGALIEGYPWSHNMRFPSFPLKAMPSYIGFHSAEGKDSKKPYGSFDGAHPGAVAVDKQGIVRILSKLGISCYEVAFALPHDSCLLVELVNTVAPGAEVILYTPAFRGSEEIRRLTKATEDSVGEDDGWQRCRPMVPSAEEEGRIQVFVANIGDGEVPVERVAEVWEGASPLPSFGAVLSFSRTFFESRLGTVAQFRENNVGRRVQVVPHAVGTELGELQQVMGGLVPAVVNGHHVYADAADVSEVMEVMRGYGATSPIAQCGRETCNFHPRIREPAGLMAQTDRHIGWVLFDGRHELSIGASVVDVVAILKKLESEGAFDGRVQQAVFVDGGSAMKAYHVQRRAGNLTLDLLNRVAAGSRNGPGDDADGLNLYATAMVRLAPIVSRPI